jgi:hypothetical protein
MEATGSSETLESAYQSTRRHIIGESGLIFTAVRNQYLNLRQNSWKCKGTQISEYMALSLFTNTTQVVLGRSNLSGKLLLALASTVILGFSYFPFATFWSFDTTRTAQKIQRVYRAVI